MNVTVKLPRLHPGQQEIKDNAGRFNVVCNGRRWGKSVLATELLLERILEGYPVAYFVPTFDFAEDVWEELKERLEPITKYRNEAKFVIRCYGGGELKVWSLEKKRSGRGRKYKRAIVDEAAFAKDLEESWNRAIRPTLADLEGDAWFFSTPQGTDNYFYELYQKNLDSKNENWKSFRKASITNPYLKPEELEEIKTQLDTLTYLQEFEAEFVTFNALSFAYNFDVQKHIQHVDYDEELPFVHLSFDFNLDPATCLIGQVPEHGVINLIDEIHIENGSIYDVIEQIKTKVPIMFQIILTGDASGYKREASTRDLINMYDIICRELNLAWDFNYAPIKNPSVRSTRILLNSILEKGQFRISPKCKHTIKDLELCNVDKHGDIDKTNKERSNHLDTVRYMANTFSGKFGNFVI